MTILRLIMDEEYKKLLIENFINYLEREEIELISIFPIPFEIIANAWLEATRQADERNSIK